MGNCVSTKSQKPDDIPRRGKRVERKDQTEVNAIRSPNALQPSLPEEKVSLKSQQTQKSSKENRNRNRRKQKIKGTRRPWHVFELLSETQHLDYKTSRNIVDLFDGENTIPFICRYRRDLIGNITPERLRDIKAAYTDIVALRKNAELIISTIERKSEVAPPEVKNAILCAKTKDELKFIYAEYNATH